MESAGLILNGEKCLLKQVGGGLLHFSPSPPSPLIRPFSRCQKEMGKGPLRGGLGHKQKKSYSEHLDTLTLKVTHLRRKLYFQGVMFENGLIRKWKFKRRNSQL